jgi:glyoxylate/hydroxypyruvate reductase
MNIVCAFASYEESALWARELQSALGTTANVSAWHPGHAQADMAVVWKPTQLLFDEQPALRVVFAAGAGVDALLELRLPPQALLVRLEDAGMAAQMAQYVVYGVLRFFREFDVYEQHARKGLWQARPAQQRADWPVGILGYGALAQPVVAALSALGFPVHAWARSAKPQANVPVYAGTDGWDGFLRATRVLVCMLPLTAETRHVVGVDALARLRSGACLINVARGGHVDERALLDALDTGRVHGALLDVCEHEPAPPDHPFWTHPRIALTPHVAASTLRGEAVVQIAAKVQSLLQAQAVSGVVGAQGY